MGMGFISPVGVMGNERADRLAGKAVQGDIEFAAPVRPSDFRPPSRVRILESWQCSWSDVRMGRYSYSILPSVTSMNRMMSNHSCLRSHLGRINIVENLMCVRLGDYETINHVM
jgi:hypothetical protein